jgi:hypothetical protein
MFHLAPADTTLAQAANPRSQTETPSTLPSAADLDLDAEEKTTCVETNGGSTDGCNTTDQLSPVDPLPGMQVTKPTEEDKLAARARMQAGLAEIDAAVDQLMGAVADPPEEEQKGERARIVLEAQPLIDRFKAELRQLKEPTKVS